jgi:hypothetical protein
MNPLEREAHKHWERWNRLRHTKLPLPQPKPPEPEKAPPKQEKPDNVE